MTSEIVTLQGKDEDKVLYPTTHISAVLDDDGKSLDEQLDEIKEAIQNGGGGSTDGGSEGSDETLIEADADFVADANMVSYSPNSVYSEGTVGKALQGAAQASAIINAMQNLPNGEAVSAQVAVNTSKLAELEDKVSNANNDFQMETNEEGFFVTDGNNNIGMSYTPSKGFDAASVSEHFKGLVCGTDGNSLNDYGYENITEAVKHLLTMEKVKEPSFTYPLTELEQTLHNDAVAKIKSKNPNGKYMTIGFITDLHESADGGIYSPEGKHTTSEPSVKLLGSIADSLHLDCVCVGGDLSCGGDLDFDEYSSMMEKVRGYFNKYINVPTFFSEGNHDRWYNSNSTLRTNAQWMSFLERTGWLTNTSQLHYLDNKIGESITNTYYVDFPQKKVRLISLSAYEKWESSNSDTHSPAGSALMFKSVYDSLQFPNNNCEDKTVVAFGHRGDIATYMRAYLNGETVGKGAGTDQNTFPNFNGGTKGKGAVGVIRGHVHDLLNTAYVTQADRTFINVDVAHAYQTSNNANTANGYNFSVFVIDTDNWILHEIRVGRYNDEKTYEIAHN